MKSIGEMCREISTVTINEIHNCNVLINKCTISETSIYLRTEYSYLWIDIDIFRYF